MFCFCIVSLTFSLFFFYNYTIYFVQYHVVSAFFFLCFCTIIMKSIWVRIAVYFLLCLIYTYNACTLYMLNNYNGHVDCVQIFIAFFVLLSINCFKSSCKYFRHIQDKSCEYSTRMVSHGKKILEIEDFI